MNGRGSPGAVITPFPRRELPTEEPFRARFASEIVEAKAVEWVVPNLIPRGTVSLLAGAPFLGKTQLMQQLMVCAGLGKPWFGLDVMKCRSYAVFSEDPDERVLIPRRDRILAHLDADFRDLDESVSWSSPSDKFPMFDPALFACQRFKPGGRPTELWRMLLQHCTDLGVALLILDNAGTVLDGEDPAHVIAFCRLLFEQALRTQIAIVLLIHPPKDGSSIVSGTQKWMTAIRHVLVLERSRKAKDEDDYDYYRNDDGRRILRLHNSNWTGERPRIYMRWEGGVLVEDEAPIEPGRRWPLSRTEKHELVLACVKAVRTVIERGGRVVADMEHAHSLPSRSRHWKSWQGYTREQTDDAVAEAIKSGYLVREGKEVRVP